MTNSENYISELLTQKVGSCGDFANLLSAMLAVQGVKSRIIGLYNYPESNGHVVLEVWINDGWVVFDPTYSSYFSLVQSDGREQLLSFKELHSGRYNQNKIKHTILNKERYKKGGDLAQAFAKLEIYQQAEPSGVIGHQYPMYFPLFLDTQLKPKIVTTAPDACYKDQGSVSIGFGNINRNHKLTLSNLQVGNNYLIKIDFKHAQGEGLKTKYKYFKAAAYKNDINNKPISELKYDIMENNPYSWEIPFTAQSNTEVLFIKHFHTGNDFLYLNIDTISLIEG